VASQIKVLLLAWSRTFWPPQNLGWLRHWHSGRGRLFIKSLIGPCLLATVSGHGSFCKLMVAIGERTVRIRAGIQISSSGFRYLKFPASEWLVKTEHRCIIWTTRLPHKQRLCNRNPNFWLRLHHHKNFGPGSRHRKLIRLWPYSPPESNGWQPTAHQIIRKTTCRSSRQQPDSLYLARHFVNETSSRKWSFRLCAGEGGMSSLSQPVQGANTLVYATGS